MKILSKGIILTALNDLVKECNRKHIVGNTADVLSIGLGFKSFKDFIEVKYFNSQSIPEDVINLTSIITYEDLESKVIEAQNSKLMNSEQVIQLNTKVDPSDTQTTTSTRTKARPIDKKASDNTLKPVDKVPRFELL